MDFVNEVDCGLQITIMQSAEMETSSDIITKEEMDEYVDDTRGIETKEEIDEFLDDDDDDEVVFTFEVPARKRHARPPVDLNEFVVVSDSEDDSDALTIISSHLPLHKTQTVDIDDDDDDDVVDTPSRQSTSDVTPSSLLASSDDTSRQSTSFDVTLSHESIANWQEPISTTQTEMSPDECMTPASHSSDFNLVPAVFSLISDDSPSSPGSPGSASCSKDDQSSANGSPASSLTESSCLQSESSMTLSDRPTSDQTTDLLIVATMTLNNATSALQEAVKSFNHYSAILPALDELTALSPQTDGVPVSDMEKIQMFDHGTLASSGIVMSAKPLQAQASVELFDVDGDGIVPPVVEDDTSQRASATSDIVMSSVGDTNGAPSSCALRDMNSDSDLSSLEDENVTRRMKVYSISSDSNLSPSPVAANRRAAWSSEDEQSSSNSPWHSNRPLRSVQKTHHKSRRSWLGASSDNTNASALLKTRQSSTSSISSMSSTSAIGGKVEPMSGCSSSSSENDDDDDDQDSDSSGKTPPPSLLPFVGLTSQSNSPVKCGSPPTLKLPSTIRSTKRDCKAIDDTRMNQFLMDANKQLSCNGFTVAKPSPLKLTSKNVSAASSSGSGGQLSAAINVNNSATTTSAASSRSLKSRASLDYMHEILSFDSLYPLTEGLDPNGATVSRSVFRRASNPVLTYHCHPAKSSSLSTAPCGSSRKTDRVNPTASTSTISVMESSSKTDVTVNTSTRTAINMRKEYQSMKEQHLGHFINVGRSSTELAFTAPPPRGMIHREVRDKTSSRDKLGNTGMIIKSRSQVLTSAIMCLNASYQGGKRSCSDASSSAVLAQSTSSSTANQPSALLDTSLDSLPPKKRKVTPGNEGLIDGKQTCYKCCKRVVQSELSFCLGGCPCCGSCLQVQVKTLLARQTSGALECQNARCHSGYLDSQLRSSLPPMVIEILEEKLEREYLDGVSSALVSEIGTLLGEDVEMATVPAQKELKKKESKDDGTSVPGTWTEMSPNEEYKLVDLDENTSEFIWVSAVFHETMPPSRLRIVRIQRVQNHILWQFYNVKKKEMQRIHSSSLVSQAAGSDCTTAAAVAVAPSYIEEKHLFHGTSRNVIPAICTNSFDWRHCGTHGTAFGQGSYFARDASYSHMYTDNGRGPAQAAHGAQPSYVGGLAASFPSFSRSVYSSLHRVFHNNYLTPASMLPYPPSSFIVSSTASLPPPSSHTIARKCIASLNHPMPIRTPTLAQSNVQGLGQQVVPGIDPNSTSASLSIQPANQGIQAKPYKILAASAVAASMVARMTDQTRSRYAMRVLSQVASSSSATISSGIVDAGGGGSATVSRNFVLPPNSGVAVSPSKKRLKFDTSCRNVAVPTASLTSAAGSSASNVGPGFCQSSQRAAPVAAVRPMNTNVVDSTPTHTVFMAKVLVGRSTLGRTDYRKPPPIDPTQPYGRFFDSCVNSIAAPTIYVIFNNAQAYPEYIIEYQTEQK